MRKKLLYSFIILLLLILFSSAWLLGTQSGLNALVSLSERSETGPGYLQRPD